MTPRQRKEAVFHGTLPDQMVWFADLTYWYSAHRMIGDLPAAWQGDAGTQRMHEDLGAGRYVPGGCAFHMREGEGVEVRHQTEGDVRRFTWQTPIGTLTAQQVWCPDSFSNAWREHPVKSAEDLRIVRYIEERRQYIADPAPLRQADAEYGEFGLPHAATRPTPMFELYKTWVGALDLIYLLADDTAEVMKTIECMAEAMRPQYQITAEGPCEYIMLCENLTAETMGGLFDLHSRDYLTEQIDLLHRHGKKVMIHIDGTLRGLVEKLPAIGVDCLDAVTPKPVGDVGVDEIRALVGDDLLILGGLPGAMFAPPFTDDDIRQQVLEIIRLHKDSGRWMFGVADQVPPNGDIHRVKLVSDLIAEYGRY